MEKFFMGLADRTRLRLLNLMRGGEVCVETLVETLGESQPKVSRHLAYLRSAGLVETRREGKRVNYSIVRPDESGRSKVLAEILEWLEDDLEMLTDLKRFNLTSQQMPHREPPAATPRRKIVKAKSKYLPQPTRVPVIEIVEPELLSDEPEYDDLGHNEIEEFLL